MPPQTSDDQRCSPSKLCKSVHNFAKLTLQGSCKALELQNLKISSPKTQTCASRRSRNLCLNEHTRPRAAIFVHTLTRADSHFTHWHMPSNAMTSCMTSSSTTWFNPFIQPNTDLWPRFEPPAKINFKKEKEKGGFDQVGPLTLTKKSKFSKRTYPTQFFKYIPILGSVSSFKTRKLCKRPISKSWLLHKS